jgi:tetratricopeptide (TPR) repeat protein
VRTDPRPLGPKDLAGFGVNVRPLAESANAELGLAYQDGLAHMKSSEWDKAIAAFDRGFLCATAAEQASLVCLVGLCHFGADRLDKAGGAFYRSQNLAIHAGDVRSALAAKINGGVLLLYERQYKHAHRSLTESVEESREARYLEGQAKALFALSLLSGMKGNQREARRLRDAAVEAATRDPDAAVFSRLLFGAAYDDSELNVELGEELLKRPGAGPHPNERELVGLALKAEGLFRQRRFAEAEPLFEQVMVRSRQMGETEPELGAGSMLVQILLDQGRRKEAIPILERMCEIESPNEDRSGWRMIAAMLGRQLQAVGDIGRALPFLLESFWSAYDANDKDAVGGPLRGLVEIYQQLGAEAFGAAVAEHGLAPERVDRLIHLAVIGAQALEDNEEPAG